MRICSALACAVVLVVGGAHTAVAADEPLSACFKAVGTFLTTNTNPDRGDEVVGRSLISLTNGGHMLFTDSNEGGEAEWAPFTDGRGAWRCVSDDSGKFHILATLLDFTVKTAEFPEQKIARLDFDATYDEASDTLDSDVTLYFIPFDANPMDKANLKEAIRNRMVGIRVTPP
jgi:hypothetical protein